MSNWTVASFSMRKVFRSEGRTAVIQAMPAEANRFGEELLRGV